MKPFIGDKISSLLHTVLRLLSIRTQARENRQLWLFAPNHTNLREGDATELASLSLSNPSQAATSTNNLLAYRPRHANGNLAGAFINMIGVFPCLQSSGYAPICQVFSEEEDTFRGGRALIGAADVNSYVFSSTNYRMVYGVAIQNCSEWTTDCFPLYHSFVVACYLPRATCS